MVFTIVAFFEIAVESWPEWDLNDVRRSNRLRYHVMIQLTHRVNVVQLLQFHRLFSFRFYFGYRHVYFN